MNQKKNNSHQLSDTALLLDRITAGDKEAENELVKQCYPLLSKWAHGRIPYAQKSLLETSDLVQETIIKGIKKLDTFESKGAGAFLAYLRKIFINCINESARKPNKNDDIDQFLNQRTHFSTEVDLDELILYEQALLKLNDIEQQAVILRIEFGFTYAEIAQEMNKPSEDAARMYVSRILAKLAKYI